MEAIPSRSGGRLRSHAKRGSVLVVDDEPLLLRSMRRILEPDGIETQLLDDPANLDAFLNEPGLDVVLLDLFLGPASGLDVLERIKRERPELEVVVMTGHASIESAVGCIRRGAFDYLEKPFDDVHRVRATVRKAVERRQLVQRNRELEEELRGRDGMASLVGSAPPLRALLRQIAGLRHNESSVLIVGESGTGKELAARSLHATSPRARGPFVPVDCGAHDNPIDRLMLKKGGEDCIENLNGWTTTLDEDEKVLSMLDNDATLKKILSFRIRLKKSYPSDEE